MMIGALLRIEVERAFKSRMFWLMLLLGIIITGIEFVIAPLRYSKDIIGAFDGSIGNTINTVFNSWFFSLQKNAIPLRQLYIMIMPLMAVFAYGYSAVSDIKSGYIENIYTRIDKKYYLIVKCVVSSLIFSVEPSSSYLTSTVLLTPASSSADSSDITVAVLIIR